MSDRLSDRNDLVRFQGTIAESGGGAETFLPVADPTGVTVDTTTYDNTVTGVGKLTTLVFPTDTAAVAFAISGDAFPRLFFLSDPTDALFYVSDGTVDPESGAGMLSASASTGASVLQGWKTGKSSLAVGVIDTDRGEYVICNQPLQIGAVNGALSFVTGAPAIGGRVGDLAINTAGGALTTIYRCTTAGTAGNAVWTGIL